MLFFLWRLASLGYPNKILSDGEPPYSRFNSVILDLVNKTIYELPDYDHRGEFTSLYGNDRKEWLGWVNWEIP